MTKTRAPSESTLSVLSELLKHSQYGYGLMKATGLKSGSLYPILMRLTERGYLTSTWQASPEAGRPPRQIYELTVKGRHYAQESLQKLPPSAQLNAVTS